MYQTLTKQKNSIHTLHTAHALQALLTLHALQTLHTLHTLSIFDNYTLANVYPYLQTSETFSI